MLRNEINANILNRLSDKDKLSFRRATKHTLKLVKENVLAPYRTKAQFVSALTGVYRLKLSSDDLDKLLTAAFFAAKIFGPDNQYRTYSDLFDALHQDNKNVLLESAWNTYNVTILSASMSPSIIYKLKHLSIFENSMLYRAFTNGEEMKSEGRQYSTKQHTWDVNQAWLLAQVHKGRRFALFSPVNDDTVYRQQSHQKKKNDFSAFAREIAGLIKIGYRVFKNNGQIELRPSAIENLTDIRFDQLTVADDEINAIIARVK